MGIGPSFDVAKKNEFSCIYRRLISEKSRALAQDFAHTDKR